MKVCTELTRAWCFSALQKGGPTDGFLEDGTIVGLIVSRGIFRNHCLDVLCLKSEINFNSGGIYLLCIGGR